MKGLLPAALIATAAGAIAAAPPRASPTGEIARGEAAYRAYGCAACHGTTGAGGGWQGPRLAPDPLPYAAFIAQLREPSGKMPPYRSTVLREEQAMAIHAYLRSIPAGKRAADIAILNR